MKRKTVQVARREVGRLVRRSPSTGDPLERRALVAAGAFSLVLVVAALPATQAQAGLQSVRGDSASLPVAMVTEQTGPDFNGDGFADLAVGAIGEKLAGMKGRGGAVNVIYGTAQGLNAVGNQFWSQNSRGIKGTAEAHDFFGWSLATGDFDGDGFTDLAVGVVDESIGSKFAAGAVNVIYGSAAGLSAVGDQFWSQDSPGIRGTAEAPDVEESAELFGSSLAAGDFDGDGRDDLAVGVPNEDLGATDKTDSTGAVNVIYGSRSGLTAEGNQLWTQDSPGIKGAAEFGDYFGQSLAAGDFDADGFDDLVAGTYEDLESPGYIGDAGSVHVIHGASGGLRAAGNQRFTQRSLGIPGVAAGEMHFGAVLAIGDLDGDGFADLSASAGVSGQPAGVVVLYGSGEGLSGTGSQLWKGASLDPEMLFDAVYTMAVDDFDGDGFADLVVGGYLTDAEGAVVMPGTATGLTAAGYAVLAVPTQVAATGDYNGDGVAELAAGSPSEALAGESLAGVVRVFDGTNDGLSEAGQQLWNQDSPGIRGTAEFGDYFALSLGSKSQTGRGWQ